MPPALSAADVRAYHADGVLFPIPVLSAPEAEACRARFEALVADRDGRRETVRLPHLEHRWAYDLACHPALLDAVEAVLGPDVVVHSTLILCKPPHHPAFVSWHQDGLYRRLRAPRLVTAWLALTPSTPENGCLRVIPGSHRAGILEHRENEAEDNLLNRGQTIEDVDESRALDLVLAPGEMSLHHGDIVHGSNPNHSAVERIGFVVRCVTPEVGECPHPVIPARGRADLSHLEIAPPPPVDS